MNTPTANTANEFVEAGYIPQPAAVDTPDEPAKAPSLLIADMDQDERPREKALKHGLAALTDAELLALIFSTGIRGLSVIDLSKQILKDNDNRMSMLARMTPRDLQTRYKGIGMAKAVTLCAAIELGMRAERDARFNAPPQIRESADAYELLRPHMQWLDCEEFWCLFLSRANRVINKCCISQGGLAATVVDIRKIMKRALQENALGLILAHNHPSGNLTPSREDDQLTKRIAEAAKTLDMRVFDHLIISATGYYSYADQGRL